MVFKKNWERTNVSFSVSDAVIASILQKIYTIDNIQYEMPEQGCANVNILVTLPNGNREIVRIYCRDYNVAMIERAVMKQVADVVPVPVIRAVSQESGYTYAVLSYVPGVLLRDVLLTQDIGIYDLMRDVGRIMGRLSQWGYGQSGFFDEKLEVGKPLDYVGYSQSMLAKLKGSDKLDATQCQKWIKLIKDLEGYFPDTEEDRLVHGDFDPSNILVQKVEGRWQVSAILDWEFAHAGSPMQDMANMLRYRDEVSDDFCQGFLKGVSQYLVLPSTWEITVDLCNVMALLDCLVDRTDIKKQPKRYEDVCRLLSALYQKLSVCTVGDGGKPTVKKIEVVAYDDNWPKLFLLEEQVIKKSLGANCIEIHHIGSTSVRGLAAKPKLDIIAAVADIGKTIEQLQASGYQYRGEWNIPGKYGFTKRGEVRVNLHVYPDNHPEIECNLLFRDFLCEHPDVKAQYAQIKQQLLEAPENMERVASSLNFPRYTIEKSLFIHKVLKQAGFTRARILKPLTDLEWQYLQKRVTHADESHILCYQGVDIVGYAIVGDTTQIVLEDAKDQVESYRQLIHTWLSTRLS